MKKQEIYEGELNTERIQAYLRLEGLYNIDSVMLGYIFNTGAEWGVEKATDKTIEDVQEIVEEAIGSMNELADLMDAVYEGEYKPDTFTTQPIVNSIMKLKELLESFKE